MTFEGLMKLGEDLGTDASQDTKLLALCWRLGAERPGMLSEAEWGRARRRLSRPGTLGAPPEAPTPRPRAQASARARTCRRAAARSPWTP